MNKYILFFLASFLLFTACTPTADMSEAMSKTKEQFVPDKRVKIFEPEVSRDFSVLEVTGSTSDAEAKEFFIKQLQADNTGFTIVDKFRVLPDTAVGTDTWALVSISVAPMRGDTKFSSEMVSQAIMGTPIRLLDRVDEWYRVQTPDGYIAWMNRTGFTPLTDAAYNAWKANQNRLIIQSINASAYAQASVHAQVVTDLVQGVILEKIGQQDAYAQVRLPDGRQAFIRNEDCADFSLWGNRGGMDTNKLVLEAKKMLGSPYLWGGISTKGMDCSGFTRTIYFSQAWLLERDASQQAKYGERVKYSNLDSLAVGDLLFFGRNKKHITHVGMYIGNNEFIHCAGQVKINSLDPADANYNKKRHDNLVLAKRMVGSRDEMPIQPVKGDGSWYVNKSIQ